MMDGVWEQKTCLLTCQIAIARRDEFTSKPATTHFHVFLQHISKEIHLPTIFTILLMQSDVEEQSGKSSKGHNSITTGKWLHLFLAFFLLPSYVFRLQSSLSHIGFCVSSFSISWASFCNWIIIAEKNSDCMKTSVAQNVHFVSIRWWWSTFVAILYILAVLVPDRSGQSFRATATTASPPILSLCRK